MPDARLQRTRDANSETFEDWFRAHGYLWDATRDRWGIAWSCRTGYDFTDLEFCRAGSVAPYTDKWDAVLGHHASGENPRMFIGRCETVADMERLHEAIRVTNGYPTAAGEVFVCNSKKATKDA